VKIAGALLALAMKNASIANLNREQREVNRIAENVLSHPTLCGWGDKAILLNKVNT
jgi:hypothetical protein